MNSPRGDPQVKNPGEEGGRGGEGGKRIKFGLPLIENDPTIVCDVAWRCDITENRLRQHR